MRDCLTWNRMYDLVQFSVLPMGQNEYRTCPKCGAISVISTCMFYLKETVPVCPISVEDSRI